MDEPSQGGTAPTQAPGFGDQSATVYKTIFEEMEDAAFLIDVDHAGEGTTFTFRHNNPAHQRRAGLSEGEIRGETPETLLEAQEAKQVRENYQRCVDARETIEYEEELSLPDGTKHWQTKLTPLFADGEVAQIVGVSRDITEKRLQATKLSRLNRRFKTVLETMTAAVFLKDTDGEYLLMNEACRDLFNVSETDIDGLTDADILPAASVEEARADDQHVVETGAVVETEETVPTASGTTQRLTRKAPVSNDAGEVVAICGVSTDITDQKRREAELSDLKERFELAVEGASLGVWDWDLTTDVVRYNSHWAQMLGYAPEDLENSFAEWERLVHPDDMDRIEERLEKHLAGDTELYDGEIRMQTAGGDWKWIRTIGQISDHNDAGEPVRAVGIHLDIDERKANQEALERQRDNLELLNQYVRHDVRNALQLVLAYGDELTEYVTQDGQEHLDQIMQAGENAVKITETAAEVTEVLLRTDADQSRIDLQRVLTDGITDLRESHEEAEVTIPGALPPVHVQADDLIESVFRNLLRNAVVHNDSDRPEVSICAETVDTTVRVEIADNGPGIPAERRDEIFEEGNKGLDSEGTGIGLYLVSTLVDQYEGDVWVEENEPTGARFVVELPIADSES
jgi:PAS domain S-box-containing protein